MDGKTYLRKMQKERKGVGAISVLDKIKFKVKKRNGHINKLHIIHIEPILFLTI